MRLKFNQSGMPKRPSKRRLQTERACFHWLQQLELRFQPIFKKRRKKRLFTSCLVSRAFPRHEEPKVDQKKPKKYIWRILANNISRKLKKKKEKLELAAPLWLAQPKETNNNISRKLKKKKEKLEL